VFAYVLAYLTLSLMLLGLTGSTLHLLFRSGQTDRRLFQHLARIRDVERQLREDVRQVGGIEFTDDELVVSRNSATVTWSLADNKAVREVFRDGERHALMSVSFRRGTQLTFVPQSESLFALRIIPSAPASTTYVKQEPTRMNTPLHAVEIQLAQFATAVSGTQ
jgi:type II secretory pathway component PulJ